jgi:CheY-like chemotaxis protein
MAQRIFIKVVGFSDEERHALNTVFRLSEQCLTMYQLWTPTAPDQPRVALLDGQSWEARVEAESPLHRDVRLLWVGAHPPAAVWRAFPRPLAWPDVIEALDGLFAPESAMDLDLGQGPDSVMSQKHALIVSADRNQRLYLRARLALARLTLADEAESGAQAIELARARQYDLALVDSSLPDADAWALLRQLRQGAYPIRHLALTQAERTVSERLRAWLGGADALLEDPPHPGRLDAWLSRIELGPAS